MNKLSLSNIARKLMEQPQVAPDVKPAEPTTKPGKRPNPLRPPKEAPKPNPKGEEDLIKKIAAKYLEDKANLNEKKGKYSLYEMLSEINLDDIKKKFIEGRVVSKENFDDIMKVTNNKLALAVWMIKRIEQRFIKPEDIYKWEDYFNIFKRRKREFPVKDINQIKTEDQIDDFVNKAVELLDAEKDPGEKKGVSKEEKYKPLQIGEVNGFKVYKIPSTAGLTDEESDKLYGAACDLGSGTQWCTATGNTKSWFDRYAKDGPLYIFIGPGGEKYQFHYESNQYMDKNDRSILGRSF
jgi:hypothetical protein